MQWCTKNNFLIASYKLVFQKPSQMCTQIGILDLSQLPLLNCFQCVQFSKLQFGCLLLFVCETTAVQSFVPRSVCLFFEAALCTHNSYWHVPLSQLLLLMLLLYQVFEAWIWMSSVIFSSPVKFFVKKLWIASWQWFVCHFMHSTSNNQVKIARKIMRA